MAFFSIFTLLTTRLNRSCSNIEIIGIKKTMGTNKYLTGNHSMVPKKT